jgi:DNA polymerase/3'-5' exonuclease PolX
VARSQPSNAESADALERVADLLEAQDGNRFRMRAYRGGAETLRGLQQPAVKLLEPEGTTGLE